VQTLFELAYKASAGGSQRNGIRGELAVILGNSHIDSLVNQHVGVGILDISLMHLLIPNSSIGQQDSKGGTTNDSGVHLGIMDAVNLHVTIGYCDDIQTMDVA
jgi:hypothetical protein